jgi:hypothetical protein
MPICNFGAHIAIKCCCFDGIHIVESKWTLTQTLCGCKIDFFCLFVTLISTSKIRIKPKLLILFDHLKSNGTCSFFIVPSSLHLTFQKTLYHRIWTGKGTPKIFSKIMLVFRKLGIKPIMKTNSINKKNKNKMIVTSILKARTKKTTICKKHSCIFKYLNFTCQLSTTKKIQFIALQGLSKNIRISIQLGKWMSTLVKKKCTQKFDIIFKNSFLFFSIWRPQYFTMELFFDYFIMLSDIYMYIYKSSFISISSIFIFFFSCIFVFVCEWWRKFLFFLLGIRAWKTQRLQVSRAYVHLWWLDFHGLIWEGSKDQKNDDPKKMKESIWEVEILVISPYFLTLMTLHMNSLTPKYIIFYY